MSLKTEEVLCVSERWTHDSQIPSTSSPYIKKFDANKSALPVLLSTVVVPPSCDGPLESAKPLELQYVSARQRDMDYLWSETSFKNEPFKLSCER